MANHGSIPGGGTIPPLDEFSTSSGHGLTQELPNLKK